MVILWDKIPLSNALAMSLQTAQRSGKMPPRCAVFPSIARFQQAGNPLLICSILTLGSKKQRTEKTMM